MIKELVRRPFLLFYLYLSKYYMYLEKLEIQGFKSFANKNKLIFSGLIGGQKRGLTAIVGPNGSGKSNVADAIRWALGEQSLKTLRGKKSEDVIFSGSDKKNQLGLAEVSLYLNNSGVSQKKIDLPEKIEQESDLDQLIAHCQEIVITRRVFRSGESEYLLNNSRVRLADVQMLLAKANFGQKTYSVIGQGLVENFLNTSTAERKDFFDEATGVKQFQIKRDSALNKLEASYENSQQVDMLLAEIKPRLKSLTRQVEKLQRRSQLESDLKENQLTYYSKIWREINNKLNNFNQRYLEKEKIQLDRNKKFAKLSEELNKIKITDNNQAINDLQPQLQGLNNNKNKLQQQLAKIQAELEVSLESQGQFDLSWLNNKKEELKGELTKISTELITWQNSQSGEKQAAELTKEIRIIDNELQIATNRLKKDGQKLENNIKPESLNEAINNLIIEFLGRLDKIDAENDLNIIKDQLRVAKEDFQNKINRLHPTTDGVNQLAEIKKNQADIISLNERKQALSNQLHELRLTLAARQERLKACQEKEREKRNELESIEKKLAQKITPPATQKIAAEKNELTKSLEEVNQEITKLTEKIKAYNKDQDQEKALIFDYQKGLQHLQAEINTLTAELNDLKIEATRQETRLEDLENNIREDELTLSAIKEQVEPSGEIDLEKIHKKIGELKNQLEQIGGIDPETEKEYQETKERYDFLSRQTADLNKAIKSLEEIIFELDVNIKERFDKEFQVISEKFNDYFKILFNGGQARIAKIMLDDAEKEQQKNGAISATNLEQKAGLTASEIEINQVANEKLQKIKFLKKHNAVGLAGVDIQATPPGKKINSVAMLSGGERALTAIALICAIISANPSPFVVLDEADAALDEANSERLARILDDLSNKTQFIVITHNRASMRKASILYGVTMEADGVSKLLSIKLEDTKK